MVEMIERVGIGGNFLKEKETTRRLRAGEHYLRSRRARRTTQWKAEGRDEVRGPGSAWTCCSRPGPSAAAA